MKNAGRLKPAMRDYPVKLASVSKINRRNVYLLKLAKWDCTSIPKIIVLGMHNHKGLTSLSGKRAKRTNGLTGQRTQPLLIMVENIPHGSEAFEIERIFGIGLEIFSKAHDEIIYGAGARFARISPADFQKFVA